MNICILFIYAYTCAKRAYCSRKQLEAYYKELFGKICYCNTEKYPFVMATTGATTVISKKISSEKNVIIEISDGLANGNSMLF